MIQEHKIPRDTLDDPRFALHGYTRSYWDRCEVRRSARLSAPLPRAMPALADESLSLSILDF